MLIWEIKMRKAVLVLIMISFCFANGCIAIVGNGNPECKKRNHSQIPASQPSAIPDIDMVKNVFTSEEGKIEGYKAIASRPDLSPADKIYLADAVKSETKIFEEDKDAILLLLINSTCPTSEKLEQPTPAKQ
jgi:hypothetical protein